MVQEYPFSSTLVAFGIGLGVGVIVGHTICQSLWEEPPKSVRDRAYANMEGFSHKIAEAIRTSLPESISRHMQAG